MSWAVSHDGMEPANFSVLIHPVSVTFILRFFSQQKKEVNTILGDVIKHMTPDRAFEDYYPQVCTNLQVMLLLETKSKLYTSRFLI